LQEVRTTTTPDELQTTVGAGPKMLKHKKF